MKGKHIFLLFIIILLVTYYQIFFIFYQQEEWIGVGHALAGGFKAFIPNVSFIRILSGEGRYIAGPINFLFYRYFPLQMFPFAVFALIFHFLNTVLVYKISLKISKSTFIGLITSIFFLTTSVADQAVTWVAAITTSLPAGFFSFLSIYFYLTFLEKGQTKKIIFSFLSFFVSILFKESSLFLFLIYPILFSLYGKRNKPTGLLIRQHSLFLLLFLFLIVVRVFQPNLPPTMPQTITSAVPTSQKLLFRGIFYPAASVSQIFIHGEKLYAWSEILGRSNYYRLWEPAGNPAAMETIAADMISVLLSFVFFFILTIIYFIRNETRKIIIFGISYTVLCFLPYIVMTKPTAYLESRHYYISVFGAGLLFAVFLESLRTSKFVLRFIPRLMASITAIFIATFFFLQQVAYIHKDMDVQIMLASERFNFLKQLRTLYPKIPDKTVFLITSDKDFYAPGNKIPFQHGFAYSLLVLYYNQGFIPKDLLMNDFLWTMTDQGFVQRKSFSFGYFWDINKLEALIKTKKLTNITIVGLKYNSANMKLVDVSDSSRKEINESIQ